MEPEDRARATELQRWAHEHAALEGVTLRLTGPIDTGGQDAQFVLRLEGPRREGEVLLFKGGLVMLHSFDKTDLSLPMEESHLDDVTPQQLTALLDELGARL